MIREIESKSRDAPLRPRCRSARGRVGNANVRQRETVGILIADIEGAEREICMRQRPRDAGTDRDEGRPVQVVIRAFIG